MSVRQRFSEGMGRKREKTKMKRGSECVKNEEKKGEDDDEGRLEH